MPIHRIKADIALNFLGWVDENEKPVLELVGTDDELNISTVFNGKVDVSAAKLYEVLREQKENGRRPLFSLTILDDEPKPAPANKDSNQPEVPKMTDEQQDAADKARRDTAAEKSKNALTEARNVC